MTEVGQTTVLITGAQGFVGRHLCESLKKAGFAIVRSVRKQKDAPDSSEVCISHESSHEEIRRALVGVDVVVHLAARVHQMNDQDSVESYNDVNCSWPLRLADECVNVGVKRFIFLSTVKVFGDSSVFGRPFTHLDKASPSDAYGRSKLAAENGLLQLSRERGLEVVILRPPLVYGPGVKANFRNLMSLVRLGVPLPFGKLENRRSILSVFNLVDLICKCIQSPEAAGHIFLCSDGDDVSTTELIQQLACSMGKKVTLIPVPGWFLTKLATLLGRGPQMKRLCESLQVDISETKRVLHWSPPVSVEWSVRQTCRDYLDKQAVGRH